MCYVPLNGNGFPKGSLKEYQFNIIGVPKGKKSDNSNNGRRIFVPLDGKVSIQLSEGPFQILDHDATQGSAAFQLPSPCDDCDGTGVIDLSYSVFARPLGKPGGSACMTTCAQYDGVDLCSAKSYLAQRVWGKSTAVNVADTLLGMYVYDCANDRWEFKELFDDDLENYYWEYDNKGLKVLQLRFYACSTSTVDPNGDLCPPGSEFWCVDNSDLVDTLCADDEGYVGVDPGVDKCDLDRRLEAEPDAISPPGSFNLRRVEA